MTEQEKRRQAATLRWILKLPADLSFELDQALERQGITNETKKVFREALAVGVAAMIERLNQADEPKPKTDNPIVVEVDLSGLEPHLLEMIEAAAARADIGLGEAVLQSLKDWYSYASAQDAMPITLECPRCHEPITTYARRDAE